LWCGVGRHVVTRLAVVGMQGGLYAALRSFKCPHMVWLVVVVSVV